MDSLFHQQIETRSSSVYEGSHPSKASTTSPSSALSTNLNLPDMILSSLETPTVETTLVIFYSQMTYGWSILANLLWTVVPSFLILVQGLRTKLSV